MGNRPTPTKLKLLTGNPGGRPINLHEPEPEPGIPSMPEWLKEFPFAVAEWERESSLLYGMGVLTLADGGILAMRSYLASQIQEMAHDLQKEGRVAYVSRMDSAGNEIMEARTNPKAGQLKAAVTEHRQLGSLLGLDPASRTRLTVIDRKKKKFDGLVNGK
jgi:P27 family predicted phage terminase small subunit